jgi:2-methylcitrate dehydratase PrpD
MPIHDIETRLAAWAAGVQYEELPQMVLTAARTCLQDWIGVTIAGAHAPGYALLAQAIEGLADAAAGNCLAFGRPAMCKPAAAAWLNGAAGHILDFDDTSYAGTLHATACVAPAALAAAQHIGAPLGTLLTAFVAGVEVELALGLALGNAAYARGTWTTSALGVIGAAVGAARAMGLGATQMRNAIGLAANFAGGLRNIHGANGKPYACGLAARNGYEAAVAAAAGIECPAGAIDGRFGLAQVLGGPAADLAFATPPSPYRLLEPGMALKRYPLCSAAQAAVDALLQIKTAAGLQADRVERIDCTATPLVVACLRYPTPESATQAQFSLPFALATALLDGPPAPLHLHPSWLNDKALRRMMARVYLQADPLLATASDPLQCAEAARVEVRMDSGDTVGATVLAAKGMPGDPLSTDELRKKFRTCVAPMRGHDNADQWFDLLMHAGPHTSLSDWLDIKY